MYLPLSCSFLRMPGVPATLLLLRALMLLEADSLDVEWTDSASTPPCWPAFTALRITARSGVGSARRSGLWDAGVAACGGDGGEDGREGLRRGGVDVEGDVGGDDGGDDGVSCISAGSRSLKVLVSQIGRASCRERVSSPV